MTTAKDLAWKAYLDAFKVIGTVTDEGLPNVRERFENWWSEWYSREEHRDGFYHEHNVYVDGKRYIQAE